MENFMKYWKWILAILVTLSSVAGYIYNEGKKDEANQAKMFETPQQAIKVIQYVEDGPSAIDRWKAHYADSLERINRDSSRKKRDSAFFVELSARKKTDSINLLNAVQNDVIKQQLIQLAKDVKDIKNHN